MSVASSTYHTLTLDDEGEVWKIGKESRGFPERVDIEEQMISISCGRRHFACVGREGNLYLFGESSNSQFSIDCSRIVKGIYIYDKIEFGKAILVRCGANYTVYVTEEFEVYSFGNNNNGQLGFSFAANPKPTKIPKLVDIHYVSCGLGHTLFLNREGFVYSCGNNVYGQLGIGNQKQMYSPTLIEGLSSCISVACGTYFSIILTDDGNVLSFGDNSSGQLGLGDSIKLSKTPKKIDIDLESPIQAITCGDYHTVFLESYGTLWGCGENTSGQLGRDNLVNFHNPIQLMKDVITVSCGGNHMIVKKQDGIFVYGSNSYLQLGIGDSQKTCVKAKLDEKYSSIIGEYSTTRKIRAKSARSHLL